VTFELPPASHAILEQAALARRVSGLVPKRPQKAKVGTSGKQTAETRTAATSGPGNSTAAAPPGFPESPGTK